MADAGGMDLVEHQRMRIGLHRIERVAGKRIEETFRRRLEAAGMEQIDRLARLQLLDRLLDACEARQFDARGRVHGSKSGKCAAS